MKPTDPNVTCEPRPDNRGGIPENWNPSCDLHDPLQQQVGGSHYKNFKVQPVEFIAKNRLGFLQGSIIKRICRYNRPGGKGFEDLEKIKHECDLLMALDNS